MYRLSIFIGDDIFEHWELLHVGHVLDIDRTVGRDEEISTVRRALGPGTRGSPPETTIIYGKPGTGKSLVTRCASRQAQRGAESHSIDFRFAYVDCSDSQSDAKASREVARQLSDTLDDQTNIPRVGIGAANYRDITWELLDTHDIDVFVAVRGEANKLDDELLRSLTRAKESGKSDAHIGAICVSNKIEYRDRLDERLDSSLQDNELVFDPYDVDQIRAILENRTDAFVNGALEQGVIPNVLALAARKHGDARKAVDTLYEAGRIAEKEEASIINEEHVANAAQQAEINRFTQLVSGTTPHGKHILRTLAIRTADNPGQQSFSPSEIYEALATEGAIPLSEDRMYRLLKQQSFLGVTESEHTGGGHGEGSFLKHRLVREPELIAEAIDE